MNKTHVQMTGLVGLMVLALAVLGAVIFTFYVAVSHMTPDGKVPVADAGLFTALLLSFREVTGQISRIWDNNERSELTAAISNSMPTNAPNPPVKEE